MVSPVSGSGRTRQRIRLEQIPVRYLAEGCEGIGHLRNVSRAGVFIHAEELPPAGTVVALQFRSPSGALVDVRGLVRWGTDGPGELDGSPGFGVMLNEPAREYLEFVRWALEQAEREKGDEPASL
jgi:hypothetical protein